MSEHLVYKKGPKKGTAFIGSAFGRSTIGFKQIPKLGEAIQPIVKNLS